MNTQSMKYFTVAARLENLSKAAELLHISQSSLSKHILNLEKELGMPLFDRNGKKLHLNEAGRHFLKHCERILSETDSAVSELQNLKSGGDSVIRISAAGIPGSLSECLSAFQQSYSNVEYVLESFGPDSEIPDINRVDMMIYPDEEFFKRYEGYDFYIEKYLLAVNKDSSLAERISVPTRLLNGQSFVFMRFSGELEYPCRVCHAQNLQFASSHYVDSNEFHMQMIANGLGVGFLPEECAGPYRQDSRIRLLRLADSRFSRKMKVCFKRDKHLSDMARAFKAHMLDYYQLK